MPPDDPYAAIKAKMGKWPDGTPRKTAESRAEAEKMAGPPVIMDIPTRNKQPYKTGGKVNLSKAGKTRRK